MDLTTEWPLDEYFEPHQKALMKVGNSLFSPLEHIIFQYNPT
jgi:hypothetical protein